MFKNKIKKNNKLNTNSTAGFSLVEMLVAVGIFMSIMTIAITSLISIIDANKKTQLIKSTIDSVTFAIENISKDMRIGTDYKCMLSDSSFSNICPLTGSTAVRYTNGIGQEITYRFSTESNQPIIKKTDINGGVDLISRDANVNINNMIFYVIGADHELDTKITTKTQPRVIITASGLISVKGSTDTSFNLQATVSQRVRR